MEQTALAASGMGSVTLVVVLLVAGMVLLGVELLVLPGFGVAGIVGALALLGGMLAAWIQYGAFIGGVTVAGTLVGAAVMISLILKSKPFRKRLVLDDKLASGGGTEAQDLRDLVGKRGTAHTVLRPAGIAEIDGRRVDVVSQGGFIERNESISVVEVDGPRVIVARID